MIGVIADDLTGAAELGAVGLRHGLRAEIVRSGRPGGAADLVCVDTDSRSCKPVEAAQRAAAAAKLLRGMGAKWIYKKVDSVLRGNVTAEVEAVMKQLDFKRALLLPANPSLGRVIRSGEYFVHGRPIHRTEFAKDPEYPRRTAHVLRMLGEPEHFLLQLANGKLTVPENTLLIGQTDSSEHVRQWAGASEPTWLPVGGSEFFGALLGKVPAGAVPSAMEAVNLAAGRQFFICGTSSKSVQAFVKAARAAAVPVFSLPRELVWATDFSNGAARTDFTAGGGLFDAPPARGAVCGPATGPRCAGGPAAGRTSRGHRGIGVVPRAGGKYFCRGRHDFGGAGAENEMAASGSPARMGAGRRDARGRGGTFTMPDHQAGFVFLAGTMDLCAVIM